MGRNRKVITAKAKGERSPTVSFSHSRFHIASGIWRLPPDLHLKATAAMTTSGVVGNANPISGGCRAFQSIQSDRMPLHGTSNRKHPSVVSFFRPVARSVGIHISKITKTNRSNFVLSFPRSVSDGGNHLRSAAESESLAECSRRMQ